MSSPSRITSFFFASPSPSLFPFALRGVFLFLQKANSSFCVLDAIIMPASLLSLQSLLASIPAITHTHVSSSKNSLLSIYFLSARMFRC